MPLFSFTPKLVSDRRIFDSVDTLLTLQNPSGGFASYELIRGSSWLEQLNAAEVFGKHFSTSRSPILLTEVVHSGYVYSIMMLPVCARL